MKIYLVGGAIRDELLGRPIHERDWVVVGATEEEMLELGYKKVGRDFPVFLHPVTHEEYALARTERKIGPGYINFSFNSGRHVTLEEDLVRRDLTVNAMAKDTDGKIIDPYHGQEDLKNKILRHISPAFAEDPVRILRTARFAATFGDFIVHHSTFALMEQMLKNGEVDALVPERVWQEFQRALQEKNPENFFTVLNTCHVLEKLFPELVANLAQALQYLTKAVKLTSEPEIRFAALVQNLDKENLHKLCNRYRAPNAFNSLANLTIDHKNIYQDADKFNAEELLNFMEKLDAFRRGKRFEQFLLASESSLENIKFPSPQLQKLQKAFAQAKTASIEHLDKQNLTGEEIRQEMHNARLEKIKVIL